MAPTWKHPVTSEQELRDLYGPPIAPALIKEIDHVNAHYRMFIERSPFGILATCGSDGIDCSPRGDAPGFARVHDDKTLLIPDRPGNNRIDSLCNIVANPWAAVLFLIPGVGETLRAIGDAIVSADPDLAQSFAVNGKVPRTVIVIAVRSVFFQCAKAIVRSRLWDEEAKVDRRSLPSVGTILAELSNCQFGGEAYDRELASRTKNRLY
jgi:PPOX class probable FMN-dependent enzyme